MSKDNSLNIFKNLPKAIRDSMLADSRALINAATNDAFILKSEKEKRSYDQRMLDLAKDGQNHFLSARERFKVGLRRTQAGLKALKLR